MMPMNINKSYNIPQKQMVQFDKCIPAQEKVFIHWTGNNQFMLNIPTVERPYTKINYMIDTGSQLNILRWDAAPRIGATDIDYSESEKFLISGFNGSQTRTLGSTEVSLIIGKSKYKIKFYLVHHLNVHGIIGAEFLKQHTLYISQNFDYIALRKPDSVEYNINNITTTKYVMVSDKSCQTDLQDNSNCIQYDNNDKSCQVNFDIDEVIHDEIVTQPIVPKKDYSCNMCLYEKYYEDEECINQHFDEEYYNNGCYNKNVEAGNQYTPEDLDSNQDLSLIDNLNYEQIQGKNRIEKLLDTIDLKHLKSANYDAMENIMARYCDVFYLKGDHLTVTDAAVHEIETTTNVPINKRQYRFPESTKKQINEEIEEMRRQGIIRPSKSPWNAPVLCIPKKDLDEEGNKKHRIVVDFRALNLITKPFVYPIPQINEILDSLGDSKYFSTIDLKSGFYQVPIDPRDAAKTAFSTPKGHFEFTRMPMGLRNSPSTFQRLMNTVLFEIEDVKAIVYLDDIIVFGRTIQEHNENLIKVLKALRKHNLKIEPTKCQILKTELKFLGHTVDKNGIRPLDGNIKAIREMAIPKTVKGVRSFLGTVNFYGKFIPGIAEKRKPLNDLLKKNVKFNWTPECQKAFEELKNFLTSDSLLVRPNYKDTFVLTTDASEYAIGAVLSNEKSIDRPIAYASRGLIGAERKYHTIEKELLAIVWAVNYFRHYIYNQRFIVYTDHRPLISIWHLKETSSVLTRLRLKLQGLECDIRYKQGKDNVVADFLSRLNPDNESEEQSHPADEIKTARSKLIAVVTRQQTKRAEQENVSNQKHRDRDQANKQLMKNYTVSGDNNGGAIADRDHESEGTKTKTQKMTYMNDSVNNNCTGSDLRGINKVSNIPPASTSAISDEAEVEESIMADVFDLCNNTHTNDTFAASAYDEFLEMSKNNPTDVNRLKISRNLKSADADCNIVILNSRSAFNEISKIIDLPHGLKDFCEDGVVSIPDSNLFGIIVEGKSNSMINTKTFFYKLSNCFNQNKAPITASKNIHLISFRKIKQFEVLEMIQFLALKNQITLSLYNADSERTEVRNEDIETILREFHDAPLGGHVGARRMRKRIGLIFNWKNMRRDIENYVKQCDSCQKNKICKSNRIPLKVTTTSSEPFEKLYMDIVVLPESEWGNKYALVMQDDLTRFLVVAPMDNQEAETVSKTFVEKFICKFGTPLELVTDQGANFMSKFFKHACKILKIKKINTSAYHPQANLVERSNRELKTYLRQFVGENPQQWDQHLDYFTFEYNTTNNSSTSYSPFELLYGRKARIPTSIYTPTDSDLTYNDYFCEMKQILKNLHENAKRNLIISKEKRKIIYDKKTEEWQPMWGELVLVQAIPTGTGQKLQSKWRGPYAVVDLPSEQTTIIKNGNKFEKVHNNRLKKYND